MTNGIKITLEAARVNAGLSQEDAAEKCGVSRETIINWEKGKTKPNRVTAIGLSTIYGIPLEHIFLPVEFPKSE